MVSPSRFWRNYKRWKFLHPRQYRRWVGVVGLMGMVLITLFGAHSFREVLPSRRSESKPDSDRSSPFIRQAIEARDAGHYDKAMGLVDKGLERDPNNAELQKLSSEFTADLKVDFKLQYLPGGKKPVMRGSVPPEVRLTPADSYYFTVTVSDRCYLYVFQVHSAGDLIQLCPNPEYVPTPNPLPAGNQRIPDGFGFLHVKDVPGIERIYLVAARWRQRGLEELSARITSEEEPRARRQRIEQLVTRLELEEQSTDKLPGLVYGSYEFKNDSASGSR